MRHKYLEDIDVRINKNGYFTFKGKDKLKHKRFRKKYGFDERECWNLDVASALFVYEHLKHFKETAPIEYPIGKYDIPLETETKQFTFEESVSFILVNLEAYFNKVDEDEYTAYQCLQNAFIAYAIILPSLWW